MRPSLALLAAVALSGAASAQCDPLQIQIEKDVYQPYEPAELVITGPAGSPSILLVDVVPGPLQLPGIGGTLEVGFSDSLFYAQLPPIPGNGELRLSCDVECFAPILGVQFYVQLIGLDLDTLEYCPSNGETLLYRDDFGACTTEGCTPGYWKNHLATWGPTGYEPGDSWSEVFGSEVSEGDFSLLDAAQMQSSNLVIKTLGSHAVAALLNASHPDSAFPLTPEEVIEIAGNAALGDKDEQEAAKDLLEGFNATNCPF